MTLSTEQVQQWVKEWAIGCDPEVEIEILRPHDNPQGRGEILPLRIRRHGYQMIVGIPEGSFPASPLPEDTCRTLERVVRLLRSMEERGLRRA